MSHFVGFVFGSNVDELLEPYDENMVVDAYVRYTKVGIFSQMVIYL